MAAKINLFPVGNGDMTLVEVESGAKLLIDVNIRAAADNPDEDTPDVAADLRSRLDRDDKGRLYVDAFLLTHPDQDHCGGFEKHFHLGLPDDWSADDDKIFIREIWSSPIMFRRASRNHKLCNDAKAFDKEARRRVARFLESEKSPFEGDRILILGEDENGKTDKLQKILIKVNDVFSRINSNNDHSFQARLLAPLSKSEAEETEERLSKNGSSTIIQFIFQGDEEPDRCRFLCGGDAEVFIWEQLWDIHREDAGVLSYDVLLTPHHCSWRSLSYDSWSAKREEVQTCIPARNALSQARSGALLIASSKPIKDDGNDPPCIRAEREYKEIANDCTGDFKCIGDKNTVMEIQITQHGAKLLTKNLTAAVIVGSGAVGREPLGHG